MGLDGAPPEDGEREHVEQPAMASRESSPCVSRGSWVRVRHAVAMLRLATHRAPFSNESRALSNQALAGEPDVMTQHCARLLRATPLGERPALPRSHRDNRTAELAPADFASPLPREVSPVWRPACLRQGSLERAESHLRSASPSASSAARFQ